MFRSLRAFMVVVTAAFAQVAQADDLEQLTLLTLPSAPPDQPARETQADPKPAISRPEPADQRGARRALTIVVGGDLGLNAHGQPAEPNGARRHGAFLAWADLTTGIRPLIDGDLNFANLETVVTARNDLPAEAKTFNFHSHPSGVRHLAGLGFNLLSTANNHAIDFGAMGMRMTMAHLDSLKAEGLILAHAGVGLNREAAGRPQQVAVKGVPIAFAALGIDSGGRAGPDRPGLMAWRAPEDVEAVIDGLGRAVADYRILSVHYGREREVETDRGTIAKLRHQALITGGVDLVAGHHAHVVQGIEITDGRLIFYGLGNLLHPGMQNMNGFGLCQDYGLLARIHLAGAETGRLKMVAVEAIPIGNMHWTAERMAPERAAERIHVLNHLAAALDDRTSSARGLRFAPQPDGSGLHCEAGAELEPGRVAGLCQGWAGVTPTPAPLKARIAAACGRGGVASAAPRGEPATKPQTVAAPARGGSDWQRNVFGGN